MTEEKLNHDPEISDFVRFLKTFPMGSKFRLRQIDDLKPEAGIMLIADIKNKDMVIGQEVAYYFCLDQ